MGIINAQTPNYDHYVIEEEVALLKEALASNSLTVSPDFFTKIGRGDIIEIYTFPENKQLYCNREFRRLCSYTEQQLKEHPFTKLYWRPDEFHHALIKRAMHVITNERGPVEWNLPVHEMIESLHPRKRTWEMEMRWIAPCFHAASGEKAGFVTAHLALCIFEWDEDLG